VVRRGGGGVVFLEGRDWNLYEVSKSSSALRSQRGGSRKGGPYLPYRRGEVVNVREEGMSCVGRIRIVGDMLWQAPGMPRIKPGSVFVSWSDYCSNRDRCSNLLPCLIKPRLRWAILVDDILVLNVCA
jgi:hypothetical protein